MRKIENPNEDSYDRDYANEDFVNLNDTTITVEEVYITPKMERVQHRRNRSFRPNSASLGRLGELARSKPCISTSDINNVDTNLFKIGRQTYGSIDVPGGWNITKGVFNMVVKEISNNIERTLYITGYTDHYDISYSGLFDDTVDFHINKIYVTGMSRRGNGRPHLIDIFNVTDNTFHSTEELMLLRTEDATLAFLSDELYGEYDGYDSPGKNTTNISSAVPVSKSSKEAIGPRMVRDVLGSLVTADSGHLGKSRMDVLGDAYNLTVSPSLASLDFIAVLSGHTNYNTVTDFTLKELEYLFGDFEVLVEKNVKSVIAGDPTKDFADMSAYDDYALAANETLYNMGNIAAEHLLTSISFKADNLDGKAAGQVLDANTIIRGIDSISFAESALRTFLLEVWPIITENNRRTLEVVVDFSSSNRGSKVEISFDGARFEPYYLPSYMDSLLSPDVHTTDSYNSEIRSFESLVKLLD